MPFSALISGRDKLMFLEPSPPFQRERDRITQKNVPEDEKGGKSVFLHFKLNKSRLKFYLFIYAGESYEISICFLFLFIFFSERK
jgi:hypothetical protein